MNKKVDDQIRNSLLKETAQVEDLKEKTWEQIQQEIFSDEIEEKQGMTGVKWIATIGALVLIIWGGLATPTGKALMQELKDFFVEEKEIELEIEGDKETTEVALEMNEDLDYIMYVDHSRYRLVKEGSKDRVMPHMSDEVETDFPEVYMDISRVEGMTRTEQIALLKETLEEEDMVIRQDEDVTTPLESTTIRAIEKTAEGEMGSEWDTPIIVYYVTNEIEGQFYLIEQKYFLEASEGHGVRLDSMLESFEIVTEKGRD